ncbi:MAG: hypothetical protein RR448_08965 [Niameybacter sp.]|uniref:hypothetical protein n=1 Tax=Niameybacter sp. TaxID=2033640 RepID=UPI002FCC56E9
MKEKLQKFMAGRYGVDQLGFALLITCLIVGCLDIFIRSFILTGLTVALLILFYYRSLSRNMYKRQQENFKFIRFWTPIQKRLNLYEKQFKERKTHKYFTCSNCKQTLRVPKGKGKVCISCPKCKQDLHKRT